MKVLVLLAIFVLSTYAKHKACVRLATEAGAVCVCNATYCDTVPALANLASGEYQLYTTSLAKLGFVSTTGKFGDQKTVDASASVVVDAQQTYQTISGIGGAFTDAAGINIAKLSKSAQELLLESYFGTSGIEYSIGRVPIGGADFSTRGYSYCDEEDETLGKFALQEEDLKYKIPFIQRALELRGKENLKLFASAWSAPIWMKTNDQYYGFGKVLRKYYGLWAEYYLKFFDKYKENDIEFWAVTTQNEPSNGLEGHTVPNNGFDNDDMTVWVSEFLGPYMKNSSYKDINILLHDDQRSQIPDLKAGILDNADVIKYVDGVAVHWYTDSVTPAETLNQATSVHKSLYVLASEACIDFHALDGNNSVDLGNWQRGEQYVNSIVEDFNYNVIGWVEWNMVLNGTGQPNYINFTADAPVIVSETADEFYKQPMFYALGHFSKFVVPQSVRVDAQFKGVTGLAVLRPDQKIAVVLNNSNKNEVNVTVSIGNSSTILSLEAYSINTLLYAA